MTSRGVITTIATVAACALVQGCPSNLEPLFVAGFVPLQISSGECTADNSLSNPESEGTYDVALAAQRGFPGYGVGIAVTSQLNGAVLQPLVQTGNTALPVVDSNTVELEEAQVSYQLLIPEGEKTNTINFGPVAIPASGTVAPGATIEIPQLILQPEVAAQELANVTNATLIATVTLSGRTLDEEGDPAESIGVTPDSFVVNICNGCLLLPLADGGVDVDVSGTACPLESTVSGCFGGAQPDGLECLEGVKVTPDGGAGGT